ncbi:ribosome maturation factor RimM [Chloroflexota bacterium]
MGTAPEYLLVGRIIAPWGTKGEVKVHVITDFPDRLVQGEEVYLDGIPLAIERSRYHKGRLLLKLATIDSTHHAEKLRRRDLTIPRSQIRSMPPDQYYHFQLIGLKVRTTGGDYLGEVADILVTAGNDVYIVRGDKKETLIPAIEDVVKSIDLEKGEIVIEAIEGLL